MTSTPSLFNPDPRIQSIDIGSSGVCLVVDDALRDPQGVVELASEFSRHFAAPQRAAYPGLLLPLPQTLEQQLGEFFGSHVRSHFGARRTRDALGRYALVTTPPSALQPCQWLPHRDRAGLDETTHCIIASVLYLFSDPGLGGTAFFEPQANQQTIERLVHDSVTLDSASMHARHGLHAAYPTNDNAYFRCVARVPARYNRMIFYDGNLFHSSDHEGVPTHADDPCRGRLTVNGFFTCSRSLTR